MLFDVYHWAHDESLSDAYGIAHCRAAKEQSTGAVHVHLAAFIPDGNLRGVFQFCFVILPQACGIQGAMLLLTSSRNKTWSMLGVLQLGRQLVRLVVAMLVLAVGNTLVYVSLRCVAFDLA